MSTFRIISLHSNDVKAACQFEYKGYEVSATTICKPKEVVVFSYFGSSEQVVGPFCDIPDAIEYIDKHPKN